MDPSHEYLDILVIAAHPDDAELCCGGTILKEISLGKRVGVLDLTRGELGTRGTPEIRLKESEKASRLLGLSVRHNLELEDGFFENNSLHQKKIIPYIRKYRPGIILANAIDDRHPDHGRASQLAKEACFYSGLRQIHTWWEEESQEAWRPKALYHYVQDRFIKPDFVVDISEFMQRKLEVLSAFSSQFYDPESKEPESYISTPEFLESIKARARELGKPIGATFGEAFTSDRYIGVKDLSQLL
jgi:bacillithiol biosynthesis deacetylase BshB1